MDQNTGNTLNSAEAVNAESAADRKAAEKEEKRLRRSGMFRACGIPAVLFALLTAFLCYDCIPGIAMTAESVVAVLFAVSIVKRTGRSLCSGSRVILGAMLLLGISCFITGNGTLRFISGAGIFFLLLVFLVLNFRKPAGESLRENIRELVLALLRGVKGIRYPFVDSTAFITVTGKGKKNRAVPVLIGLAIGLPLMILMLVLLCSADAVFDGLFNSLFRDISWAPFWIGTSAMLWFMAAYSIVRMLQKPAAAGKAAKDAGKAGSGADPAVGITVCIPLTVIYLVFSVIQIVFLFLGNMELPNGYSYAAYVHEGYYQLLAACLINLVLVLLIKEFVRKNRVLSVLLTVIGVCTYVMTASSALRMIMYIRAYGLTFLRVVVLWSLAVIAVLFAGVLIRVWKERFFLFRYMLATLAAGWLALVYVRPESCIAHYDLYHSEAETDFRYLSSLSADAAPALFRYAEENGYSDSKYDERWDWFSGYADSCREKTGWRETSLSEITAKRLTDRS